MSPIMIRFRDLLRSFVINENFSRASDETADIRQTIEASPPGGTEVSEAREGATDLRTRLVEADKRGALDGAVLSVLAGLVSVDEDDAWTALNNASAPAFDTDRKRHATRSLKMGKSAATSTQARYRADWGDPIDAGSRHVSFFLYVRDSQTIAKLDKITLKLSQTTDSTDYLAFDFPAAKLRIGWQHLHAYLDYPDATLGATDLETELAKVYVEIITLTTGVTIPSGFILFDGLAFHTRMNLEVHESATPALSVDVEGGVAFVRGERLAWTTDTIDLTGTEPTTDDRIDIMYLDKDDVGIAKIVVLQGAEAATPVPPDFVYDDRLILAYLYRRPTETTVLDVDDGTEAYIVDWNQWAADNYDFAWMDDLRIRRGGRRGDCRYVPDGVQVFYQPRHLEHLRELLDAADDLDRTDARLMVDRAFLSSTVQIRTLSDQWSWKGGRLLLPNGAVKTFTDSGSEHPHFYDPLNNAHFGDAAQDSNYIANADSLNGFTPAFVRTASVNYVQSMMQGEEGSADSRRSIEAWVRSGSGTGDLYIFRVSPTTAQGITVWRPSTDTTKLRVDYVREDTGSTRYEFTYTIPTNTWAHILVFFDVENPTVRLFVDGVEITTVGTSSITDSAVAQTGTTVLETGTARIAEVAVYKILLIIPGSIADPVIPDYAASHYDGYATGLSPHAVSRLLIGRMTDMITDEAMTIRSEATADIETLDELDAVLAETTMGRLRTAYVTRGARRFGHRQEAD